MSKPSSNVFNILNTYKDYPYQEKKNPLYVDDKQYKEIIKEFCKRLSVQLITTGNKIILPSLLGFVKIYKVKPRKKLIDHHATNKLYGKGGDKKVYINLNRTNGYKPHIIWSEGRLRTSKFLQFNLVRSSMRINTYAKYVHPVRVYDFFNEKGYLLYDIHIPPNKVRVKKADLTKLDDAFGNISIKRTIINDQQCDKIKQ